jgi:hypothetical protein
MDDRDEKATESEKAAAERKAALTAEVSTDDPEVAIRQARAQSPRGRTERPTTTAG